MENSPVNPKALHAAADRTVLPMVRSNKLMLIVALQTLAILALAAVIHQMLPLKTVEPYILRVTETGRTEPANYMLASYSVDAAQKAYFLSRWVESFMNIKKDRVEEDLKTAAKFTRGEAAKKLAEWIQTENPLAKSIENPNLEVHTQVIAVNELSENQALIRFYTITRGLPNSIQPLRQNWSVTAKYVLVKPTTPEEINVNPIGLYIIDYSLTRELAQ